MPTSPFLGITEVTPSQSGKETTINNAIEALEAAENATLAVSFASGDVTLSVNQFTRNFIFKATGATADHILNIPATVNSTPTSRVFAVRNASGFNITVKVTGSAGTTFIVPNGECHLLNADGAGNVAIVAAPPNIQTFLGLSDTPAAYTGAAKQVVRVKATADGLEFHAMAIADLADVDTTTTAPTNGQALVWNATAGKFVPGTVATGGGGATALSGLTDVNTSGGHAPTNGQALVWNSTDSKWEPASVSGGTATRPTLVQEAIAIGATVPVTLTSAPTAGNLLIAVGTHFNNSPTSDIHTGWQQIVMTNGANDGMVVAIKEVGAGESATQTPWAPSGSAGTAVALFEVANAGIVEAIDTTPFVEGGFTATQTINKAVRLDNSLLVGMIETTANNTAVTSITGATTGTTLTGVTTSDTPRRVTTFHADVNKGNTAVTATLPAAARLYMLGVAIRPAVTTGGGGGSTTLDGLTDVDTSSTPPTDGQALVFDNASSLWKPGSVSGGTSSVRVNARYWRIRCLALNPANASGTPTVGIAELALKDSAGSTISTGGTAIASSTNSVSFPASNAFDSNTATTWYSASNRHVGEWIGYDFGSSKAVYTFTITPDPGFAQGAPRDFSLEYSDDAVNWKTHTEFYSSTWVAGTPQTFTVPRITTSGGGAGSLTKLAQTVLGAPSASVSFPSIPSTCEDLIIVINGQLSGTADFVWCQINGDTTSGHYQWVRGVFQNSGLTYTSGSSIGLNVGLLGGAAAGAAYADSLESTIFGYARTAFNKRSLSRSDLRSGTAANQVTVEMHSSDWLNTAAVNSLTLVPNSGNFTAGTVITVYGRGNTSTGTEPWWFSPPPASQFTAISHDATLPTMTNDPDVGLIIAFGGAVAGDKTRAVYKAITTPAADWTFETRFTWGVFRRNFLYGGMFLQDSATGQMVNLGFIEDGGRAINGSWCPSLSAGGGSQLSLAVPEYWPFFKITFTNSTGNLTYYTSPDGKNWIQLLQHVYTTRFTNKPDRAGFCITTNLADATNPSFLTIGRAILPA